jgi:homocysteine S-methyltransferase
MSQDAADVRERLVNGPPLLLDGAVGSELDRRGVDTSLPLWSARAVIQAPSVLLEVHRE